MDGDSTLGDEAAVAPALIPGESPQPDDQLGTWQDAPPDDQPGTPPDDQLDDQLDAQPGDRDGLGRPPAEDPPPATGDPAVDQATVEVAATSGEPLETRLAAYERAHRTLQDRLADVEG